MKSNSWFTSAALALLTVGCSNPEICFNDDTRNLVTDGSRIDPETECRCSGFYDDSSACCSTPGTSVTCCPVGTTVQDGLCRNSADLKRETEDPGPGTMEDPNPESGDPRVAVVEFRKVNNIPRQRDETLINVQYQNLMNGKLLKPENYGYYKDNQDGSAPFVQMEEAPSLPTSEGDKFDREVPWDETDLGGFDLQIAEFDLEDGTYTLRLLNLPDETDQRQALENGYNTIVP